MFRVIAYSHQCLTKYPWLVTTNCTFEESVMIWGGKRM